MANHLIFDAVGYIASIRSSSVMGFWWKVSRLPGHRRLMDYLVGERSRVHFPRADNIVKRPKAARPEIPAAAELRRFLSAGLFMIDECALHPLEATDTDDRDGLVVPVKCHCRSNCPLQRANPDVGPARFEDAPPH